MFIDQADVANPRANERRSTGKPSYDVVCDAPWGAWGANFEQDLFDSLADSLRGAAALDGCGRLWTIPVGPELAVDGSGRRWTFDQPFGTDRCMRWTLVDAGG